MSNIQQPEMRRSGHDPLVTDSVKERAQGRPGRRKSSSTKDIRPAEQRSRYGPENPEPPPTTEDRR
jgi:hypothetical protein